MRKKILIDPVSARKYFLNIRFIQNLYKDA